MNPLLDLIDCRISYPGSRPSEPKSFALQIDRLTIRPGDRIALLGKSGAGKSTLLAKLRSQLGAQCSWCPQHAALVPQLRVFHNIYAGALARHSTLSNLRTLLLPSARHRAEIEEIATPLGIADLLWRKADELSGGQQQRVAIARALYQRQPLLLADEPVAALDKHQGQQLLRHLLEQHHTSVVALHHTELALALCNRVIGLKDQRIAFDTPADELDPACITPLYQ